MKTRILITSAAIVLSVLAVFAATESSSVRPLLMAHRGGFAETEENTLKAYNNAIDRGIDIIECDPKLTKDGKWIIMHDETLDRTTTGVGKVADLTFEQIQNLRTKGGEPIPAFEQVLDLAKNREAIVFIDLHLPPPDIAAFFKIVDGYGLAERVIVNTWVEPFQREMRKLRPDIVTCFPYPKPAMTIKKVKKLEANIVGTLTMFASARMIEKSHKLGLSVVTMPINDTAKIKEFAARGLDIIQTDDPRLTESVFGGFGIAPKANLDRFRLKLPIHQGI